jgi:hypothetical protein
MVTVLSVGVNEKIPFRLFHMPCCNHPLCWVSPRLPNHCPECGANVLLALMCDLGTLRVSLARAESSDPDFATHLNFFAWKS